MKDELVTEAIQCLSLRDIVLYESRFIREVPYTESPEESARTQSKKTVKYEILSEGNDNEESKILQILVCLGLRRIARPDVDGVSENEERLLFSIEADYLVEYEVNGEVNLGAIEEFSKFNAPHNVWPFWRQHVFDTAQKAKLPRITIPLFTISK